MKVAAAYIRVSTDDQLEYSPESQLDRIKQYAERNQILLPKEFIFVDEGISGRTAKKRPAFNEMIGLAKCKPKPFDVILVWKFSRFARSRTDSVFYKSMLRHDLNIDVVSVSEDIGDDHISVLIEAIIEAMDEYYSINLAEEVKRGMTQKAKQGGILSIPGFGYKVENGEYVIIPEEATIIRKVFNDYINGKGFLTLAKSLNAMGIKSHRGNPIETRTVEYWLNNPVYIGKIRWNPEGKLSRNYDSKSAIVSDGTHTPIIDIETWKKAQERIAIQKKKFRKYYTSERKDLSHWLTGIVRCEKCGAVLSYQGGYFGCSKKGKGLCDGNGYIKATKLEQIVIDTLSDIMSPSLELEFSDTNDKSEDQYDNDSKIIAVQIERLKFRLERVERAYEDGADTIEEYKEKKNAIQKEIGNLELLEKQAKEEKSYQAENNVDKQELKRLTEILQDQSINHAEKNKLARLVIKEIVKGGEDGKCLKCVLWG